MNETEKLILEALEVVMGNIGNDGANKIRHKIIEALEESNDEK